MEPNESRSSRAGTRSGPWRDLAVIAALAAVLFAVATLAGLWDAAFGYLEGRGSGAAAELLALGATMALAVAVFAATQLRRAIREAAERETTERRLRALVEEVPAITYTWDPTKPAGVSSVHYVSPQIESILGYRPEEWTSDPKAWVECIHPDDRARVIEESDRADRTGEPFRAEYRVLAKDGRVVWMHDESVVVAWDDRGRPTLSQGVMLDITRRKETENRLQEAENRFRTIVEKVPAVAYVWDASNKPGTAPAGYISPQIRQLLGFDADEWLQDPTLWAQRLHPDDLRPTLDAWDEAVRAGVPFAAEYRMFATDGRLVWIRDEAIPISEGAHGLPVYQGVMLDVTESKEVEGQLREAEHRYRTLVEHLPVVPYVSSAANRQDTTRWYVAPRIVELTGYSSEEWARDSGLWERLLHPADRDRVLAETLAAEESGSPYSSEYRMVRRDGSVVWVRDEAIIVERGDGPWTSVWQGVFQDVTARRRTEEQLRATEAKFRTLIEQIPAITYIEDPGTGINLYISPQIETMFGYTPEEWTANPRLWEERLHPEDRDWVLAENAADLGDAWSVDYRTFARDGRMLWVHNDAVLVRDDQGNPLFWQGVVFDITERKQAEQRLREAEQRYRTLVEQLPAVVYIDAVDAVSTALYVSPQYERLTGYTPEERLADPDLWVKMLHPEDRERVLAESERTNETGEPFDIEYRIVTKDGRVVWVHDIAFLVGEEREGVWQGVLTDITERRRTEEALAARDRILEAAGFAAERFLNAAAWSEPIDDVLAGLGEAVGASRAYVFENQRAPDGSTEATPRSEWRAPGTHARDAVDGAPLRFRAGGPGRWEAALADGEVIHGLVRDMPPDERPRLERDGTRSLCVVPVFVRDRWWGVIGFDQCDADREWQQVEIDALRVVANTLGAAIGRDLAERRLNETEQLYRTLVEQLPAITYIEDPTHHRAIYISPQLGTVLGYERHEWGHDPFFELLHPDDLERVRAEDERTNQTGEPFRIEYRQRAKDGRWVWLRDEAHLIRDERGNPLYWQGVRFDITAQKEAEQQLRGAERRYRTLVEQLPAVTYVDEHETDATTWRSVYISPQVEEIFGYSPQEWRDDIDLWPRLIHPDDRDRVVAEDHEHYETGSPLAHEYRMRTRDGEVRWIRDEAVIIRDEAGRPRWSQGILIDITAQKEAERQLAEAEERYRSLVETIPAAIYVDAIDHLSKAIYMSPQVEQLFGYTPEEWIANPELWERRLHPDDREAVVAKVQRLNADGVPYEAEYRFRRKDGTWVWVRDQAVVIRDQDGRALFAQGFMFDITDRMRAVEQLRSAEERFRGIVEHVPAAIYLDTPDQELRTVYISPQIEEITGFTPQEWQGDPDLWGDNLHPDDRDGVLDTYREFLTLHRPWSRDYRFIRKDGREIWVHDETVFIHGEDGQPLWIQGVVFDITERKRAEQQLRESEQRLRSLDEMKNTFLAAVSHELRSPLTSILGLSLTLERQADHLAEPDRMDLLERLSSNARKLDRLLKDLLDIDRLGRGIVAPQYRVTDVGALARRTVESLDALAGREVTVHTDPVVIAVDPAKVERIIENLLVNAARHAGEDRGIWLSVGSRDGGVLIAVEDDGPGVPPELRDAIFEPFRQGATASKSSPGTGIGLSLVARFSELHGGRAWVEDRAGGGASFKVFLPAGPVSEAVVATGVLTHGGNGDAGAPDAPHAPDGAARHR